MSRLVPRLRPSFCPLAVHIADNEKPSGHGMGNETCDSDSINLAAHVFVSIRNGHRVTQNA